MSLNNEITTSYEIYLDLWVDNVPGDIELRDELAEHLMATLGAFKVETYHNIRLRFEYSAPLSKFAHWVSRMQLRAKEESRKWLQNKRKDN